MGWTGSPRSLVIFDGIYDVGVVEAGKVQVPRVPAPLPLGSRRGDSASADLGGTACLVGLEV